MTVGDSRFIYVANSTNGICYKETPVVIITSEKRSFTLSTNAVSTYGEYTDSNNDGFGDIAPVLDIVVTLATTDSDAEQFSGKLDFTYQMTSDMIYVGTTGALSNRISVSGNLVTFTGVSTDNIDITAPICTLQFKPNAPTSSYGDQVTTPTFNRSSLKISGGEQDVTASAGTFTRLELGAIYPNGSTGIDRVTNTTGANAHRFTIKCTGCLNQPDKSNTASNLDVSSTYNFYYRPGATFSLQVIDETHKGSKITTAGVLANRNVVIANATFKNPADALSGDVDANGEVNTLDVLLQRISIIEQANDVPLFTNAYGEKSAFNILWKSGEVSGVQVYKKVENVTLAASEHIFNPKFEMFELGMPEVDFITPPINDNTPMALRIGSPNIAADQELSIAVTAAQFNNVAGYQGTMTWGTDVLEFTGITPVKHAPLTNNTKVTEGALTLSWIDGQADNTSLASTDTLFLINFQVIGKIGAKTKVNFSSGLTAAAAYSGAFDKKEITTIGGDVTVVDGTGLNEIGNGYALGNAIPNPFIHNTSITFNLPQQQDVTFTVFNTIGQVSSETIVYAEGINLWAIPMQKT